MITIEQAKILQIGDILYQHGLFNTDGTARKWKVNGKVKVWKRDLGRIKIPVKYGMFSYGYVTEQELVDFSLTDPTIEEEKCKKE